VRQCFYSFQFAPDNWRVSQVRNIGTIEGNRPASDNDWETVTKSGDDAIKKWIADQMKGRSCTIVLVGTNTANRKWINHEIIRSWDQGMGVVGIHVHGLQNRDGQTSAIGGNPFDHIGYNNTGKNLSSIVKCYNPTGTDSRERYSWISEHLSNAVEEAIRIRSNNK